MQSKRKDGLGHWPAGKRRNPPGDWRRIRASLVSLLETHRQRGVVSRRALGDYLQVTERTVRLWLDGTNRPDTDTQQAIREWITERKAHGNR